MKGAFSSPDTLLEREMDRRLFPDTCYRFVSGGDPEHIPELTYEQFTATHRRLYHPSNSYIFLDGCLNMEKVLDILDSEYLNSGLPLNLINCRMLGLINNMINALGKIRLTVDADYFQRLDPWHAILDCRSGNFRQH